MSPYSITAAACIISYLFGSIPFGLLAGRFKGLDIREMGSGNIGATNVVRTLGKPIGITVFVLDVLKGLVPLLLATRLSSVSSFIPEFPTLSLILIGFCAVLGHNFPFWLGFRGGKGVATSAGVLLGLMPGATVIAAGVWVLVFLASRYVSLASIVAALILPLVTLLRNTAQSRWDLDGKLLLLFAVIIAVMGIYRHRENIKRLISKTENRSSFTLSKLFKTRPKGFRH